MSARPPSEIARDTLKLLATRKLAPSPDNYQTLYDEIAGTATPTPFPDGPLGRIARALPGETPVQKRLLTQFDAAVQQKSWTDLQRAIAGYAQLGLGASAAQDATVAAPGADAAAQGSAPIPAERAPTPVAETLPATLLEQIARLVENVMPALGTEDARLQQTADTLLHALRAPSSAEVLQPMLADLGFRLSFAAEDQSAIRAGLLASLQLIFQNIGELSLDDRWLQGQADALQAAAEPPLTLRLDDLQKRLKDVIVKQSESRQRSLDAQEQMKDMLASFIARLSQMTASSGVYQDKIEQCADRLGEVRSLEEMAPVLQEVISATRAMALDSRVHRDELQSLQDKTAATQAEIGRLQAALENASAQARHDPLTGALNRKGLDEAADREVARARRAGTAVCIGLLDIDNFKQINDRLGHASGDAALVHLAQVARESLRAQDTLARYGGEEFVVVMPDTPPAEGVAVLQRLQRELTKRYFLANNDKVLITFSAGVSAVSASDTPGDALKRADQAMYLANKAGKNRVMLA
ncbi:sensor domain-containing diguanylate cyclase [Xylophilus ampelinus]|uniref:diguanylate cyclase n=1 Tax=Xylophilus ampelinus TaxID=54067 RepID=A0A318SL15_9BURK|nr:GGDEF domain-containing protein [Xylophilus ampelinus]MCS4509418.1 diguanylate cyclase [Xylophilus ampelinus]PYE79140.1 diguanylate cyclase [Xylophilus ampelinus]